MKLAYLAFSQTGYELAQRLAGALGGTAYRSGQPDESGRAWDLTEWTKDHFGTCDGLVFVGAMGIAVRAIAPFAKDKTADPAVVVIDEKALHVIPVLSGHLGGANDLARRIAGVTGSDCVITTATDINGVFAVDEWSKRQNCELLEPKKIVGISGRLLHGAKVSVYSPYTIEGELPDGVVPADSSADADVTLDIRTADDAALHLVPRICVLGVGCRRETPRETIEAQFAAFINENNIYPQSIRAVATIDLKKDEAGLISFCESHGWPLITFTSEELAQVAGDFTASEFVSSVTGVDNVCERSALLAAGGSDAAHITGGGLIIRKYAGNGVTLALAAGTYNPNWNWKD